MVRQHAWPRLLCASGVAIAVMAPQPALAADTSPPRGDNTASADALFDEAKKLAEEGNHAEACPKFEASFNLDPTLGTLLNLADCHEKIGKIATAWAEWGESAERAQRAGDDRVAYAKERRAALEPRLPRLAIAVTNPRPGLTVVRDEIVVPAGTYGVALPVDPGKHAIRVKRGEQVISEQTVDTVEARIATVELDLEAIEKAAPPPTKTESNLVVAPGGSSSSRKTIGFVVGGGGLVLLAGAAVIEIVALSSKPGEQCGEVYCTPQGINSANKARTFANIGQWVGLAGLVATGAGVVLVVTAPSDPKPRAWLSPWVVPGAGGVTLGGSL